MKRRLSADIHRGIMIEAVTRIVTEVHEKFVESQEAMSDSLLVALANLSFILDEVLTEDEAEAVDPDDADFIKTEGTIWTSLKGRYHSVL